MSEWKTIETAPKDGTHVLISTDVGSVGEAFLEEDDKRWYWAGHHWTDAADGSIDSVTHWQPLPEPPAQPIPSIDVAEFVAATQELSP